MVSNADAAVGRFTRREMLLAGFSSALACSLVPVAVWSAVTDHSPLPTEESASDADLYAFAGPSGVASVLALTWAATPSAIESARIHVNDRSWSFRFSSAGAFQEFLPNGPQPSFTYAGPLRGTSLHASKNGIVLEFSNDDLPFSAKIWAEQVFRSGQRRRVGSLLVAAIIARNEQLARVYHSLTPKRDASMKALLAEVITEQATQARSINNPQAHGQRLAELLLPDVLHYSPRSPTGFTFASRNGRHPEEAVATVVHSMLYGLAVSPERTRATAPLESAFPYFPLLESLTV